MAKEKNEEVKKGEKAESAQKAEFRAILEAYKASRPEQWEVKKERLLAKLESL